MTNRRVESKTSRTAEFTCLARFLSTMEKMPEYKSDDYIASYIMNSVVKVAVKLPLLRMQLRKTFPYGMYEYVIARTKYMDREFQEALRQGFDQILIFGAGFDTRGVRLAQAGSKTAVFELDAAPTQEAKIRRYKEKGVNVPSNLVFVPIDFDKESVVEKLNSCGFASGMKSLFILEGLTMYLRPESAKTTFETVQKLAGPQSRIAFDFVYGSVVRGDSGYDGEEKLRTSVKENGEGFQFGIERGEVEPFLSQFGLRALRVMNKDALETAFFTDARGEVVGNVTDTHCIATVVIDGR